jgi:signal-transduction protein with cAMP-binding, CBS, and nucleotidyltransferase domain
VLNSVGVDDIWDRPIGDVMKKNVVAYDIETPVAVIWEFLQRVTLRRVVIVDNDVPTGVISRGTLLRWLGNWGAILASRERSDSLEPLGLLCTHIHAAATAIVVEAERLQQEAAISTDNAVPIAVNAATRLQEQAQDLLALCQVHYKFEPRCFRENQPAEWAGGPSAEVSDSPSLDSARAL